MRATQKILFPIALAALSSATPGTPLWSTLTKSWVVGKTAVSSDGTRVFALDADGGLVCLDASSGGAPRWTFQTGFASLGGPALSTAPYPGLVVFGSGDGYAYAVSANGDLAPEGTLVWKVSLIPPGRSDAPVVAPPVFSADGTVVYVGTTYRSGGSKLYALYSINGTSLWTADLASFGGSVVGSPAINPATGVVFVGLSSGAVVALNTTGGKVWTHTAGSTVTGPVAFGSNSVIVGTTGGAGVVAIYALSGAQIWNYAGEGGSNPSLTPLVTYSTDGGAGGTAGAGIAYASIGNTVSAVFTDANGGKLAWPAAWTAPAQVLTAPAVASGVVYAGCDDGCVYALNGTTGAESWRACTGGMVRSSPTVGAGMVVAGSLDHRVWAWETV
jgi:outer membrane protein assembly factor BamB